MTDLAQPLPLAQIESGVCAPPEAADTVDAITKPKLTWIAGPSDYPVTALMICRLRSKLQQLGVIV